MLINSGSLNKTDKRQIVILSSFKVLPAILYLFFMISSQLDDGVLTQTTTLVKKLTLHPGKCLHTNIVRVAREKNHQDCFEPKITSSIAEQEGSVIKRITEIRYTDVKYIIEDRYQFEGNNEKTEKQKLQERSFISSSQDSGNSNQSNPRNTTFIQRNRNKKLCFFQKTLKNGNKFLKRNTKNIPKNFCKAFINFMDQIPNKGSQEWNQAIKDFKKIERRHKCKYNNILMHKILSNPRICIYFKQFLQNHAVDWINNSKIADKQIHLQAIKIYGSTLNNLSYAEAQPSPSDS